MDEVGGNCLARPAPKARRKKKWWPLVLLVLAVFLGSGSLGFAVAGRMATMGMDPTGLIPPGLAGWTQPTTILVMGSDQRKDEAARADTLMLVWLDPKVPRIGVLSIPRDTYAQVPGHGYTKINHARVYGGPSMSVNAVEGLLGVPVDHYLDVNFEGFAAIVDALGGIELDVERRMYYPAEGINLKPGRQILNGKDALGFVRFRNYPEGDIERIRHQEKFLLALADQALSLKGVMKSPQLIESLYAHVKTDMSLTDMLALAKAMRNLDSSQISLAMLPGEPQYKEGISYWIADPKEILEAVTDLETPPASNEAQAKE